MPDSIDDPFNNLAVSAIAMHDMFESYVEAGFQEDHALRLVAYMVIEAGVRSLDPENPV